MKTVAFAFIRAFGRLVIRDKLWRAVLMCDPCVYCGETAAVLDHIMPRSQGGKDGIENRAPLCVRCDKYKADHGPIVFLWRWREAEQRLARRRYDHPNQRAQAFRMMMTRQDSIPIQDRVSP